MSRVNGTEKKKAKPLSRKQINAIETKQKLFKTAVKLFSKFGYDKVTVDSITQKTGVSKGTFYTYFNSKESILVEQFKLIDNHYDDVLSSMPEDASATELLVTLLTAMADYCVNVTGIDILKIIYMSQISNSATIRILNNKNRGLYRHLYAIIRKGVEAGEFHLIHDEDTVVEWITRCARGMIYDWCLYGGEIDLVKEAVKYFGTISYLLKAQHPEYKEVEVDMEKIIKIGHKSP